MERPYFLYAWKVGCYLPNIDDRHNTGIKDVTPYERQGNVTRFLPHKTTILLSRELMKEIATDKEKERHMETIEREIELQ